MSKYLKLLVLLVVLTAAAGSGWWYLYARGDSKPRYRTATAEKGELLATISATGTIEPEEVVDVGAQVAGMIMEFGPDPKTPSGLIDYGSVVDENTVLAKIDTSLYQAAVEKAEADLKQARANVERAQFDLKVMKSKLEQTRRDWDRVQKLEPTRALSDQDVDTAKNAWETAVATVPGGEAALRAAEQGVKSAEAALKQARTNLQYCTIRSPVKGVIVDRRVNKGQTVVASLNAPSLFLIAKDLKRIQIWASVNEADIGHILAGQRVQFTVDALAGQKFAGQVIQRRLNATMTQNVVTYTVVISTDNSSGKLLPYMTANLEFEVERHTDVLRVPNAALRWQPTPQEVAPDARAEFMKSLRGKADDSAQPAHQPAKDTHDQARVWVADGEFVRPVKVRIGLSDGVLTEITGGDLQPGTQVVIGEVRQSNGGDTSNPFTPQMFRQRSGQ
jgi:HlyD family secretion protein